MAIGTPASRPKPTPVLLPSLPTVTPKPASSAIFSLNQYRIPTLVMLGTGPAPGNVAAIWNPRLPMISSWSVAKLPAAGAVATVTRRAGAGAGAGGGGGGGGGAGCSPSS